LREALARTDHDFVVAEPRRRKAAARGPFAVLATLLRLTVRLAAYPNRVLGGLVFAIVVAILVNALLLQHSRHPAPLFHSTMTVPVPQEQPAPQAARTPVPADAAPVAPVQESAAPAADVPAPPAKPHDAIGQLLKSESAPASAKAAPHHHPAEAKPQSADGIGQLLKAEAAPEDKPKTVLAVQQALVKLGFVVRPDGQMGSVTRHALEQYERDHGLPVEPQLSPKLLHRLSAASGIKID
jgi:hypothetical protein